MTRNYFLLFGVLAWAALISSCQGKENKDVALQDTQTVLRSDTNYNVTHLDTATINVTAMELTAAYIANEVKADHDYKGKQIIVSGIITDIKKGIGDDIYIILEGAKKSRSVQCYYENDLEAQSLKKGDKVSFKGKCDGLWVNVILSECEKMPESKN